MMYGSFPKTRLRRLRKEPFLRHLIKETDLRPRHLIWPVFITGGEGRKEAIPSMPGVFRLSIDRLLEAAQEAHQLEIPAIALFPVVTQEEKSRFAESAYDPEGLIQQGIRALKKAIPRLGVISDVALDPFTLDGQDGLSDPVTGFVENDTTLTILVRQALSHAAAGADMVAPSDMMDGRIGAIRDSLEANHYPHTVILSYAVKYASHFYGPFREAVNSKVSLKGDKKTYQMDPANRTEALREVALDLEEGADIILVKPGLPYLDMVSSIKTQFQVPTFVYHVSGEYAMQKLAIEQGILSQESMLETILCMRRAGADAILTYAACEIAKMLS